MNVTIRSIDNVIYSASAIEVNLPGIFGKITVRPNHAPLSLALGEGQIRIKAVAAQDSFYAKNGIAHVQNNVLDILITL